MERREFIGLSSLATIGGFSGRLLPDSARLLEQAIAEAPSAEADVLAIDHDFWNNVRKFYVTSPDLIDLDNANTAPTPVQVFDAYVRRGRKLRQAPGEGFGKMWSDADKTSRLDLAQYLGTKPQHMALTPNTTVALNTVLHGFPLERGDEILVTNHEYPDMIETVLQRAKRDGITMRKVDIPSAGQDRLALVDAVKRTITPRTKLLLISHVSAWSGEVLPVNEVTSVAREHGVAVLVDAAQSVGILDVDFTGIECDFLGTSLHKWLAAPIGTGALIMRPEHIGKVWPLHPPSWDTTKYPMDIYEWTGTFNVAAYASIIDALNFQRMLGDARKRARIRFLGDYWQTRLAEIPGVQILTPRDKSRSMGIAAVSVTRTPAAKVVAHLRSNGIIVQDKSTRHSPFTNAIRVSPGIYTTTRELDRFIAAVGEVARKGM